VAALRASFPQLNAPVAAAARAGERPALLYLATVKPQDQFLAQLNNDFAYATAAKMAATHANEVAVAAAQSLPLVDFFAVTERYPTMTRLVVRQ
jgi:hypothetical protein